MKLWLDDERRPPKGWVWARTYGQAVSCLETGKFDEVSLDHDLGEDKTGYDVAVWLEERALDGTLGRLRWRVHSSNPEGARRMERAMRSAERFWE